MSNSPLILNALTDNWFDCCMKMDWRVLPAIAQAFNRMFQFDCVITVDYLILIIFPILFKIYGFGVQQRLRNFYDSSRLVFIEFLFLCSFSVILSSIMHIWIQQPMPCITWDGRNVKIFEHSSRTPNPEIIMIFILAWGVWSLKIGIPLIRKFICVTIFLLECTASILSGYSSISQILISIVIGMWIVFLFNFLPPIGIPTIGFASIIGAAIIFGISFPKFNWDTELIKSSFHLCIRGIISLLICCLLQLRFGFARDEFDWSKINWGLGWGNPNEGSSDDVVIPSMIRENVKDDFGKILKIDLTDSIIAFVVFLLGNAGLNLWSGDSNFMLE